MNAVSKVNIAGLVFQVDDEALVVLEGYLNRLKEYYECQESGAEIMESIEERIADLLAEKNKGREIVGKRSVEDVIEILGEPDSANEDRIENPKVQQTAPHEAKKLYRDPEHKVFGGLFAGVACYLGIKRNIFRLLFIAFAFYMEIMFHSWFHTSAPILWFFFVIAYFVLCFVIPLAKTWEDRMAMRGEAPDLSSIENLKTNSYYAHKSNVMKMGSNDLFNQLCVGLLRFLGLICTIFSIGLIISLVFFFFFPQHFWGGITWFDFLQMLGMPQVDLVVGVTFTGLFALAACMLYAGIKALFQLSNKWRIELVLNLVFITCIIVLGFMCVPFGLQFSEKRYSMKQDAIASSLSNDTLYIDQELPADFSSKMFRKTGERLYWDANKRVAILYPGINLFVVEDSTNQAFIRTVRTRYSNRMNDWVKPLTDEMPSYELIGNHLIIKGCAISPQQPWDRTMSKVDIFLPKGYKVVKKGDFILEIDQHDHSYNDDDYYDSDANRVIVL